MKLISIFLLAILALPVVAGSVQETAQTALQPIWLRGYHVGSWRATGYDTSFIMGTDNLDMVSIAASVTCSLRVYAAGDSLPWGSRAISFLMDGMTLDIAIKDIDSIQVYKTKAGPTTLYFTALEQKR